MIGNLLLIAFGLLLARVVFVLVFPAGKCRKCRGTRISARRWPPKWAGEWIPFVRKTARKGKCRRCKGHGRRPRIGARLVHHTFWVVFGDLIRDRIHARHQLLKDKITNQQGGNSDVQEQRAGRS